MFKGNKRILILMAVFINISMASDAKEIQVVSTIGQITDIVKYVAGDHANVIGLMGAGVDPHLYKASERDVQKLAGADIIFYNGLYLEAKMESVFEKMKRGKKVVALGNLLNKSDLLDSEQYSEQYDPHIWFDVPLWTQVLDHITETLKQYDPEHQQDYQDNADQLKEEFYQLDDYVRQRAAELLPRQRVLVTAHDAFRYFGRRYGFEVVGLQGMSTESEAGTHDVMKLVQFIVDRKIPAIFVESSVPERNIKAVQEAVQAKGWNVRVGGELYSDAVGENGSYVHMVEHNINTIVNALKGAVRDE